MQINCGIGLVVSPGAPVTFAGLCLRPDVYMRPSPCSRTSSLLPQRSPQDFFIALRVYCPSIAHTVSSRSSITASCPPLVSMDGYIAYWNVGLRRRRRG